MPPCSLSLFGKPRDRHDADLFALPIFGTVGLGFELKMVLQVLVQYCTRAAKAFSFFAYTEPMADLLDDKFDRSRVILPTQTTMITHHLINLNILALGQTTKFTSTRRSRSGSTT